MGEESAPKRDLGPWSLKEGLKLFENVCQATGVKAMRQTVSVEYDVKASSSKERKARYRYDEADGKICVFDETKVQLSEILPLLIKPKRAYKKFCASKQIISWKAIAEHMTTRSIDDIRNYWMLKVVPILSQKKQG